MIQDLNVRHEGEDVLSNLFVISGVNLDARFDRLGR